MTEGGNCEAAKNANLGPEMAYGDENYSKSLQQVAEKSMPHIS
jgi:hypothetical protein